MEDPQHDGGKKYVANVDGHDWIVLTTTYGDWEIYPKGYDNGIHIQRVRDPRERSAELLREFTSAK